MCRGNRREEIFQDDLDRESFLGLIGEVCERTGWIVHRYVLMPNHYHWLVLRPPAQI
jgi:REP element-mobilizing transposase RayT